MADGDRTHFIGDGCAPDGHRSDPMAASQLNDQLLEEMEQLEELDITVGDVGGVLSDRQAALFAAVQIVSPKAMHGSVTSKADEFYAWLAQDPDTDTEGL